MNSQDLVAEWYEKYSESIYNFLVYYTGNIEMEDLVQEVFIKAIKYKHLRPIENPKTWLFSIARNVAVDYYRKKRFMQWIPEEILHKVSSSEKTPEEIVEVNERGQYVNQILQTLKKSYREVLILRWIDDLTVAETAEVLNWSEAKVKSTYYRAFQKLKEKMKNEAEVSDHEVGYRL